MVLFLYNMFPFDPWKLLGLKSTSSIHEARRAYYKLAVLVHPDKGGNAEEMRILYEAYKWIYNQLDGALFPVTVDDPSKTPIIDSVVGMDRKSLEECYEKLRPNDDQRTRTIALDWVKYLVERDLMADLDLKSLEDYIREGIDVVLQANMQDTCYHASVHDGYGAFMDQSIITDTYGSAIDEISKMSLDNIDSKHQFSKELAIYTEPLCFDEICKNNNMISVPQNLDDYSETTRKLDMTDYALAHSHHVISDPEAYNEEKLHSNVINFPIYHSYKYE